MASDGEISCTNDPNFAVIYSFLKVFGKLYGLEVPSIAKLQESIENTEDVLDPLKDLHLRLLRRALKSVQSNRWERCLIKFCHQHGYHQEAWEIERFSYKKASTPIKLKVLKVLLEYQFTCHPKFKSSVNAITCDDLRLDPIGRDKNGCVYWYQVDDDANLCLFKEDQDEETWQVVARNREELATVISQLKNGEDVCPIVLNTVNEDSNSADVPPQLEKKTDEEDNNEEFLSPESESDQDDHKDVKDSKMKTPEKENVDSKIENNIKEEECIKESKGIKEEKSIKEEESIKEEDSIKEDESLKEEESIKEHESINKDHDGVKIDENIKEDNVEKTTKNMEDEINKSDNVSVNNESLTEDSKELDAIKELTSKDDERTVEENKTEITESKETTKVTEEAEEENIVGEAIEEPVMVITGNGNGADCESLYLGEEIIEDIMFFFGEGNGYDNCTGNPEIAEEASVAEPSDAENGKEEKLINGELSHENSNKNTISKGVKLRSNMSAVTKRALKKQPNECNEVLKSDPKKHCIRNLNKCDSSNSNSKSDNVDLGVSPKDKKIKQSGSPWKSRIKKGRSKVKKKKCFTDKSELKDAKEIVNSISESKANDSKTSIIEKRKSSVSSVEQEEGETEPDKESSPEKDFKAEEPLPPKKLRLESTPESDIQPSHSIDKDPLEIVNNSEEKEEKSVNEDNTDVENIPIAKRKKIKARKGKFKRKSFVKKNSDSDGTIDKSVDNDASSLKDRKLNKSLKRSLLDSTMSDKNKSESHSDSDDDEPVASGKRLKTRPKKVIRSSRKKVEAKLLEKSTSDESEEETLYSIAGKQSSKKALIKKKPRGNDPKAKQDTKAKTDKEPEDPDLAPVRQSRRIAQMKIKEEADRRHLEEVTLRELKMIHKKKSKDEEEWQASGAGSSSEEKTRKKSTTGWQAADSSEPSEDSDEPLFEVREEPDLDFTKSDHEFSPESDLETGEPAEPIKMARTLQEGQDDGFCKSCGSGEQPEWILLCDKCDAGYHGSCLKPILLLVPAGNWYCPPCNHSMLIESLEKELSKYDELVTKVEEERARKKQEEPEPEIQKETKVKVVEEKSSEDDGSGSSWSSSSDEGGVYRLRARKQLPVSYRSQEYDRLISGAIKEEYVEPTTSAGNQGRGKDISTIIEAAAEEQREAEREAREQGKPIETKKFRKKIRRKPRKLNSLEVPSEDDDEVDEDFKDTGMESTSEEISSSAERDSSNDSRSSDSLPIRRTGRTDRKDRPKLRESSPEVKKKKGVFNDTSSESGGTKEWSNSNKKSKKSKLSKRRDKSSKKPRKNRLTQYDAEGNVIRARVTYGGLSDEPNDWSPKHRTRQRKINYTEDPNTESEDEIHKSSGKHMPDSSDEFKVTDSELESSGSERRAATNASAPPAAPGGPAASPSRDAAEERRRAIADLVRKTVVVPLHKLPEDVTRAKNEQLQAHLEAKNANGQAAPSTEAAGPSSARRARGRGRGRGRAGAVPRTPVRPEPDPDDELARLVGVKIKDFKAENTAVTPTNAEREKKRLEREAKVAEKEARKQERLQKKEEKEKLKEQKAKEREEKRAAKLALQESKRIKKEKPFFPIEGNMGYPVPVRQMGPEMQRPNMFPSSPVRHPGEFQVQQRFSNPPRLQVRAELRGVLTAADRAPGAREGTLSVAGSPQPFKPISEEPSVITRMPHMLNQQYRGPMMYPSNSPYGPRGQNMSMYQLHPGLPPRAQYPPGYYPPMGGYRQPMRPGQGYNMPNVRHPPGTPPGMMHGPLQQALHGPPNHGPGGPANHGPGGHPNHGPGGHPNHGPGGPPNHGPGVPPNHGPGGPQNHGPGGPSNHGPGGPPNHGPGGPPNHGHGLPLNHGPGGPLNHGPGGPLNHRPTGLPPNHGHPGPPNLRLGGPPNHGPPGPPNLGSGGPPNQGLPGPSALGPGGPSPNHGPGGPSPIHGAGGPSPNHMPLGPTAPSSPGSGGPVSPLRVKAEVKTEPEYRSPGASPPPRVPEPEPPRNHPKIKHTDNKERRPRFPLGPYAPQYGPYGPYAPDGPPPRLLHTPYIRGAYPGGPHAPDRPPGPAAYEPRPPRPGDPTDPRAHYDPARPHTSRESERPPYDPSRPFPQPSMRERGDPGIPDRPLQFDAARPVPHPSMRERIGSDESGRPPPFDPSRPGPHPSNDPEKPLRFDQARPLSHPAIRERMDAKTPERQPQFDPLRPIPHPSLRGRLEAHDPERPAPFEPGRGQPHPSMRDREPGPRPDRPLQFPAQRLMLHPSMRDRVEANDPERPPQFDPARPLPHPPPPDRRDASEPPRPLPFDPTRPVPHPSLQDRIKVADPDRLHFDPSRPESNPSPRERPEPIDADRPPHFDPSRLARPPAARDGSAEPERPPFETTRPFPPPMRERSVEAEHPAPYEPPRAPLSARPRLDSADSDPPASGAPYEGPRPARTEPERPELQYDPPPRPIPHPLIRERMEEPEPQYDTPPPLLHPSLRERIEHVEPERSRFEARLPQPAIPGPVDPADSEKTPSEGSPPGESESLPAIAHIKPEPDDGEAPEGSVFGGLVSYFSSQHDDLDA